MVPNYIILRVLGLLDTYTGLVIPFLANAFGVFLMRQSMMTLNDSYLESAMLDGATLYRVFFLIVLPMVAPTLATDDSAGVHGQLEQLPLAADCAHQHR